MITKEFRLRRVPIEIYRSVFPLGCIIKGPDVKVKKLKTIDLEAGGATRGNRGILRITRSPAEEPEKHGNTLREEPRDARDLPSLYMYSFS